MSPPYDFDSLDGPLCTLVPPAVVAREEALPVELLFVDGRFTLGLSGTRSAPENETGAMLVRFDWAGRVEIPARFVDVYRTGNSDVTGVVYTDTEYVITWSDILGAPSGYWNIARVDRRLVTRDVTRSLRGTACHGATPLDVGGRLLQLLCTPGSLPSISQVTFDPGLESLSPDRPAVLLAGRFDAVAGAWDGDGLGLVTSSDALTFQRYASDGTPAGEPLALANERAGPRRVVMSDEPLRVPHLEGGAAPRHARRRGLPSPHRAHGQLRRPLRAQQDGPLPSGG